MDEKQVASLLHRAADEAPDVDTDKIMRALRTERTTRRVWARSLAAAFAAAALILAFNLGPHDTAPPAEPPEPEPFYMLVSPNRSPYPDPLAFGYSIVPINQ